MRLKKGIEFKKKFFRGAGICGWPAIVYCIQTRLFKQIKNARQPTRYRAHPKFYKGGVG